LTRLPGARWKRNSSACAMSTRSTRPSCLAGSATMP